MNRVTVRAAALVVLAALAILVVLAIRRREAEPEEVTPEVRVETAVAQLKTLEVTVDALGTVQPRPGFAAEISAPDVSRVERIYVAVGDRVSAGQELVQLDVSVWASKRREAEAALTTAQQAYDRAQRLLNEGIGPRKDVETASADLARAHAALSEARRLEQLGTLRSPISGVVTSVNAALSKPVDTSQPVVEVVDPRGLEVLFHLSPADAGRVQTGASVELSSGQDTQRNLIGRGTIKGVSAALDSVTGTVSVRANVAAPTRPLKVGELLSGRIVLVELRNALVVPVAALVPQDDQLLVFVVDAENVAHATPVQVGSHTETEAQILSGLKAGQIVVTSGAYGVTDGAHVQVRSAQ